ncbi:hypothetical protein L2E82_33353 [Cichorium intybus]|uniref:Uncharacterized protein n=1 Tax=Cichorium intybus TaxID=13427 RepID=A0ACB9BJY7_CICIN|nr:hypothetical protein L2E82_33353 [Cichorium intybus]
MASSRKRQARKHTILDPYLKPVGWKEGLRVLLDEIKHIITDSPILSLPVELVFIPLSRPTFILRLSPARAEREEQPPELSNYFLPPTSLATSGFPTSASVGLLGLLLMRLGKGIGNGLINRAGFWAHGKGEVDGGCFSARVGGGVAIVARSSFSTGEALIEDPSVPFRLVPWVPSPHLAQPPTEMALWSPSILLVGRFVRARVNPPSTENHDKQYWLKDRLWLSQIIDPSIHPQRAERGMPKRIESKTVSMRFSLAGAVNGLSGLSSFSGTCFRTVFVILYSLCLDSTLFSSSSILLVSFPPPSHQGRQQFKVVRASALESTPQLYPFPDLIPPGTDKSHSSGEAASEMGTLRMGAPEFGIQ